MPDKPRNAPSLADLRKEIDRIDEAMHRLLMERGEIIDRLIATKKTQESGSAFRPAREADMMRRLVQRHKGILPLDTAESIWRVIIATFTHVQAPFSVHADLSAGDAHDARQRAVSFRLHGAVRGACRRGRAWSKRCRNPRAISGWCRPSQRAAAPRGGTRSSSTSAPKIIARLPFIDRPDHPAPMNVFVVSRAAPDAMVTEVEIWSVRVSGWGAAAAAAAASLAEIVAVPDRAFDGAALLVSVPAGGDLTDVKTALVKAGASVRSAALVGSHATRYTVPSEKP